MRVRTIIFSNAMALVIAMPPSTSDLAWRGTVPAECNGCSTTQGQLPQFPGVDVDFHSFDGNTCFPLDPDCWQCDPDDEYGCHSAEATGSCSYWVGSCYYDGEEPLANEIASLVQARDEGSNDEMARIIRQYPHSVSLNVERSSIQVLNCKGAVVGNLTVLDLPGLKAALADL